MNKKYFFITAIATSILLTGCSSNESNTDMPLVQEEINSETAETSVQASAGLLKEVSEIPSLQDVVDVKTEIVYPYGSLVLNKLAKAPTLVPSGDELSPDINWQSDTVTMPDLIPADGEQFVVFEIFSNTSTDSDKLSFALEINGSEEPLEIYANNTKQFVKSIPEQDITNANIVVRYDGVAQKINLLTGERTSSGIAETYYVANGKVAIFDNEQTVQGEIPASDGGIIYSRSNIVSAEKEPYINNFGWADAESSDWIRIQIDGQPKWGHKGNSYAINANRVDAQWILKDDQGNEYSTVPVENDHNLLLFKVPAQGKNFELLFSSNGEIWENSTEMTPQNIKSNPLPFRFQ